LVFSSVNVATMFLQTTTSIQNDKKYLCHRLVQSYREGKKVKHKTIVTLSKCSPAEIEAIRFALKHKNNLASLATVNDIDAKIGMRIGAVLILNHIAERIGLHKALGNSRDGRLALWQVLARLIDQGSRLSAVRLAQSHSACDLLGLDSFNEDHLYENLAWLSEHQQEIELKLFKSRYKNDKPQLFLYDVTSSYLEGTKNALGAFGYNRDKKKGKMQLVVGLLTAPDGNPVAVRVFEGNTNDTKTVEEQIYIVAKIFNIDEVTFVGDKGMLKKVQIEQIKNNRFHYITSITKAEITTLIRKNVFQYELFDETLCDVLHDGIRYVFRRNHVRAEQIKKTREDKMSKIKSIIDAKNTYLSEHTKAKTEVAQKNITKFIEKFNLKKLLKVEVEERVLSVTVDENLIKCDSRLDGCYVIKTDLPKEKATKEEIHSRYKDLAKVERAFRTFKSGHLEIRPAFVRTEKSTRGHVFVVMLAYLLESELDQCWKDFNITVAEGIDELGTIRGVEFEYNGGICQKIPAATGTVKRLLEAVGVTLPEALPLRKVNVATRKNIARS